MLNPQWTFIPSQYNWIAIDGDGSVHAYTEKPTWVPDIGAKHCYWRYKAYDEIKHLYDIPMQMDISSQRCIWERPSA